MGKNKYEVELLSAAEAVCGESPIWDPESGCVFWTDTASRFIHSWNHTTGEARSREVDHTVRALGRAGGGALVLLCADGIHLLEADGSLRLLCDPERGRKEMMPDDGTMDSMGRFVFNTYDTVKLDNAAGAVYSIDAKGKLLKLDAGLALPNGMAFSPDGRILYLAEMFANRILRYDYDPVTGQASGRALFAGVPAADGMPDGLIVDADGFLWSANWAGWRITRYRPDGKVDCVIPMPFATATCMGFGGPALEDLYITSATLGLSPDDLAKSRSPGGLFVIRKAGKGIEERVYGREG